MTRSLPAEPSFENLKKQAKSIHKKYVQADPEACNVIRHNKKFSKMPDAQLAKAQISLQEVQYALALSYGFSNWKDMGEVVSNIAQRQITSYQTGMNRKVFTRYVDAILKGDFKINKKKVDPKKWSVKEVLEQAVKIGTFYQDFLKERNIAAEISSNENSYSFKVFFNKKSYTGFTDRYDRDPDSWSPNTAEYKVQDHILIYLEKVMQE